MSFPRFCSFFNLKFLKNNKNYKIFSTAAKIFSIEIFFKTFFYCPKYWNALNLKNLTPENEKIYHHQVIFQGAYQVTSFSVFE